MKRGTPFHPKMERLAALLKVPHPHAVGIMEMLWHFAAEQTPRGDIGAVSDEMIARAVMWRKKPAVLIQAFVQAGWLETHSEYRLIIHDWGQHADDATRKRLQRAGKDFLPIYRRSSAMRMPEGDWTDAARPPNGGRSSAVFPPNGRHTRGAMAMATATASSSPEGEPEGEPAELEFEPRFQAYRSRHPGTKTRVNDCRSAYMSLIVTACDPLEAADSLDRKQQKWLEYWRGTKAIPLGLFNFLAGGDCLTDPPELTEEQQEEAKWA